MILLVCASQESQVVKMVKNPGISLCDWVLLWHQRIVTARSYKLVYFSPLTIPISTITINFNPIDFSHFFEATVHANSFTGAPSCRISGSPTFPARRPGARPRPPCCGTAIASAALSWTSSSANRCQRRRRCGSCRMLC